MRALLTGGIKAILAIATLSTAAHWTLRVQRESATTTASPVPVAAGIPDPVTTSSIEPRRPVNAVAAVAPVPAAGLDQTHLAALIAGATPSRPKLAKASTKTAAAEKIAAKR
ncbi:hypothetical protein [Methylobacterium sp. NEAU K]|uniref:hypothetical protein n=1 Tax=Methylobacterium sp. NEAU K TaxID=3064946 RepID=UPI0027353AD2|nr:hypothetical protein [Methylobacterium sp. NEAU K]MDP4005242.1 hypothetical protein [Methylobacterium sp. NEAU K]